MALKIFEWKHCCMCVIKPHAVRIVPKFSFSWAGKTWKNPKAILGYKSSQWPDHEKGREVIICNKKTISLFQSTWYPQQQKRISKFCKIKRVFHRLIPAETHGDASIRQEKKQKRWWSAEHNTLFLFIATWYPQQQKKISKFCKIKRIFHRLIPAEMHGNTSNPSGKKAEKMIIC